MRSSRSSPPATEARLAGGGPIVILMVGVNGSGKTTTAAKLAARYKQDGRRVMLAAADTFRAAAQEQLAIWGKKLGVPVVKGSYGAGSQPPSLSTPRNRSRPAG